MRERLQGLWRRFGAEIVAGLLFAVVIALVGRGGIWHAAGLVMMVGVLLFVALLVNIMSEVLKRGASRRAGTLAIVSVLSLGSIPVGSVVNQWDLNRAKAWCEQHAEGLRQRSGSNSDFDEINGAPMLAYTFEDECYVSDRGALFFGEWVYTPEAGWSYWD
ncbi:MAG: hypothetical protein AAFQ43_01360 [Bacteroidota bacterium]